MPRWSPDHWSVAGQDGALPDEVRVRCKERHLALRITAIGRVGVRFDEFSNREPIGQPFRSRARLSDE
jgi:hypothetical protein